MRKTSTYARKRKKIGLATEVAQRDNPAYQAMPYRVMSASQPFTPSEQLQLSIPVRATYQRLHDGCADEPDFHTLGAVINVCSIIAGGIHPQLRDQIQSAAQALQSVWTRYKSTGALSLDEQARQHMPHIIDLHEQLLQLCTPKQLIDALNASLKLSSATTETQSSESNP
jgi:hypothetical protein